MALKIIGHRGAAGLAPENTLTSLQAALDAGVDEIEIDVHVTADGKVVLNHDDDIQGEIIRNSTFAKLKKLQPGLCTLSEAIILIDRRKPLLIEIKSVETVKSVCDVLTLFLDNGWLAKDFKVLSFKQKCLLNFRSLLPEIELVVNESFLSVRAILRARQLKTKFLGMNYKYMGLGFVRRMSRRGYLLSCYTLNDTELAHKLFKQGLYGVVTDYPDRFTN